MDEMYDCLRTSKGKLLAEASKTSAEEVFKNVLAVLIDKNAKLEVARRDADKYRGELEVASKAVEKYRLENVRLLGECAGFRATNQVLQGEVEKAVMGPPVGLPGPTTKARSRSKSAKQDVQKKARTQINPDEKKASFLDGVCETVRERLGPCTRGEGGGLCQLLHPKDCTELACHATGGRQATKCDGSGLASVHEILGAQGREEGARQGN